MRHLRQDRVPAQAALHEVAHRVVVGLLGADHALAQQQLDVAVVAAARQDRPAAQVVEAAVTHVRPPAGVLLHQAHRASGARSLLDGQAGAEAHDLLVGTPEGHVQEAQRIEQRLRRVREAVQDGLHGDLGGPRAMGMPAHAIDHGQQGAMVSDRRAHPVLVLLAPTHQADFRCLDPQEQLPCIC